MKNVLITCFFALFFSGAYCQEIPDSASDTTKLKHLQYISAAWNKQTTYSYKAKVAYLKGNKIKVNTVEVVRVKTQWRIVSSQFKRNGKQIDEDKIIKIFE